ncbi:MAG: DUF4931 domain-containing protein [Candidatus Anstonellales archaeon]
MVENKNKKCIDYLGRTIIISVVRASRPRELKEFRPRKVITPEKCYFCPGNEAMTPPESDRIGLEKSWLVRSFPNKYPAVSPNWKDAYGRHEVIVETPDHEKRFSEISFDQMKKFLILLRRRVIEFYKDKKIKYVCVFKNEGLKAGASIEHSHSQIVGLDYIPKEIIEIARHQKEKERYIKKAKKLWENRSFFSCLPPCPRFHYEVWIIPKKKVRCISEMDDDILFSFGKILLKCVQEIDIKLSYPPYNISFITAPPSLKKMSMHVEIVPRLATWGGFELGGGGYLNSISDEAAYHALIKDTTRRDG